jgi:hypothetical protein
MDIFERGNTFLFATSFFNEGDNPVNPGSAKIRIVAGASVSEIDMTQSGNVWTALWDSFGVPAGAVYWSVQAINPHSTDEGYFTLSANPANQAAPV